MTTLKTILGSFLVALAVWTFFTWPIPRLVTSAIPAGSYNVEKGACRAMMPGDPLQLLYQFWLTGDMLAGRTPAFVNPYEFNVGNDADGAFRGTCYVPFSLFYRVGAGMGGRAFGYNFSQFVSIWITFLFSWLLVRRYNRDDRVSAAAAVLAITLPYPWITMLDGSPTGFGMMWMPVLVWALDIMVAERKMWAGAVAGMALCLAESDSHVLFFALLSLPVWCGLSYLFHFPGRWPSRSELLSLLKASTLLIVFLGVAAWEVWIIRYSLQDTNLAGTSRTVEEIRANSPILSGVVRLASIGEGRKIYLSGYLIALLTLGFGGFLWKRRRAGEAPGFPILPVCLIGLGVVVVVWLSTGVMNPLGPRAWKAVVKLIPPYGMIRQPHKVYCLMPVLLALIAGLVWPSLVRGWSPRVRNGLLLLMVVPLVLDFGLRVKATACLIDREQGAFRSVAEDAEASGNPRPHLLSLPVWPGDSHYDSLNEYYVSLYRLRMVNGYGGTVRESYRTNIFDRLETMNVGEVSDAQLDFLLERGVEYLVLHENCYPDKVAPFPVGQLLETLLNAPRVKFLRQDGSVWAFKILPAGQAVNARPKSALMKYYFPARRFEVENLGGTRDPQATAVIPPSLVSSTLPVAWLFRVRGQGTVLVSSVAGGQTNAPVAMEVASSRWTWGRVPIPRGEGVNGIGAKLTWDEGAVNVGTALLVAGEWTSPVPGQTIELPAVCFFHAGYSDREGAVILRAEREPEGVVFYGLKLPLEPGPYSAGLVFESPAPAGTLLGRLSIRLGAGLSQSVPVRSGERAVVRFDQAENLPVLIEFDFLRAGDLRIRKVVLERHSSPIR